MRKFILVLAICLLTLVISSCASIFSGSSDKVTITSEPSNALVAINGYPYGRTPLTVELDKGDSYRVEVSDEGYEPGYAFLSNKLGAGWIVLDVLTGLIPLIVDAVTGSWNSISPDSVHIVLEPSL